MDFANEYRNKLITPAQAAKLVKSGDWVDYSTSTVFPALCDAALAARRDELEDVKIRGNLVYGPIAAVESDPEQEHFVYSSWHTSGYERTSLIWMDSEGNWYRSEDATYNNSNKSFRKNYENPQIR